MFYDLDLFFQAHRNVYLDGARYEVPFAFFDVPDARMAPGAIAGLSHTAMSYLPNTDEFGQFDRDHLARWQVAARLDNANRILGDVQRSPNAAKAATLAGLADARARQAIAALAAWDLRAASLAAADAYRLVLAAADRANVMVEPFSGFADQGPGAGVIAGATDPRDLAFPPPPGGGPAGVGRYLL